VRPSFIKEGHSFKGKVVIGTVKSDYHDIGKSIIFCMLEGAKFEVIDIGVDVSKENFLEAVIHEKADILGMSALLTTTMGYMPEVINYIRSFKEASNVKIIIGGTPVTQSYADAINADGFAMDSQTAVDVVTRLIHHD